MLYCKWSLNEDSVVSVDVLGRLHKFNSGSVKIRVNLHDGKMSIRHARRYKNRFSSSRSRTRRECDEKKIFAPSQDSAI